MTYLDWKSRSDAVRQDIRRCRAEHASDAEFAAITDRERELKAEGRRYFPASHRAFVCAEVDRDGKIHVSVTMRDQSRFQEKTVRWAEHSAQDMRSLGLTPSEIQEGDEAFTIFALWVKGACELPPGISREEAYRLLSTRKSEP